MLTAEEIANMPREEFVNKASVENMCTCGCGELIEEHPDIRHRIAGRQVTSDCYYRIMGNYIDKNPINAPRDYEQN